MFDRVTITQSDRRNLVAVVAIMWLVLIVVAEGPLPARVVGGLIGALLSGLVFVLTTVVLHEFGVGN